MKPSLACALVAILPPLLFSSCDRPELRPRVEPKPKPEATQASPAAALPAPEAPAAPAPVPAGLAVAPGPATNEAEPIEPEFSVEKSGDRIIVSGALTSKIQQERIVETLKTAFPDCEVESTLKLEYNRIPVGWGNRIADELLIDYLRRVKNPKLAYKDTLITIEGEVASQGELKMVTEAVIDTFSGGNATDIENKLEVRGGDKER